MFSFRDRLLGFFLPVSSFDISFAEADVNIITSEPFTGHSRSRSRDSGGEVGREARIEGVSSSMSVGVGGEGGVLAVSISSRALMEEMEELRRKEMDTSTMRSNSWRED